MLRRPAQQVDQHPLDEFVSCLADLLAQWWIRQPESSDPCVSEDKSKAFAASQPEISDRE